jgi:hypothetical protein
LTWTGSWSHGDFVRSLWRQYFVRGLISLAIRQPGGTGNQTIGTSLHSLSRPISCLFRSFSAHPHLMICQSQNARGCKTWWEILAAMCRAAQSAGSNTQKTVATRRDATCFFSGRCIHGSQCWGVHTAAEIQLFRHREGLAQAIEQRSPRC